MESLDDCDDEGDDVRDIYIEPPITGGYFSGKDDTVDDDGGWPDDVCPGQLKANCEIVLKSGERLTTFDENANNEVDSNLEKQLIDAILDSRNEAEIEFTSTEANVSTVSNEQNNEANVQSQQQSETAHGRKRKAQTGNTNEPNRKSAGVTTTKTKQQSKSNAARVRASVKKGDAIEFTWKNDDTTEPLLPLFPNANYGDCTNLKPHEQFEKFFDVTLLKIIIQKSGKYALSRQKPNPNITIREMRTFIGILLISGYNYHSMRSLWSNDADLRNELVFNSMRRNRFDEILASLHFEDNSKSGTKENPNPDKLWKLSPLTDYVKSKMIHNFHPAQLVLCEKTVCQNHAHCR